MLSNFLNGKIYINDIALSRSCEINPLFLHETFQIHPTFAAAMSPYIVDAMHVQLAHEVASNRYAFSPRPYFRELQEQVTTEFMLDTYKSYINYI